MPSLATIMQNAYRAGVVVPAFNVPYLPMVAPVGRAVADLDAFALIEVARIEWLKFESRGPAEVQAEFARLNDRAHLRLHLDHIPVIDEDGQPVDYLPILRQAIELGYDSVMLDGSSLGLEENMRATREAVALAHAAGIPCEAELGAIAREGSGKDLPYEEIFRSGYGFTEVEDARRFAVETGCDWLSVAVGNIHGAVSQALRDKQKTVARLDLDRLEALRLATGIPLVLHGGSGVRLDCVQAAFKHGIAKINVGFEIRRAYEDALRAGGGEAAAQAAVYARTCALLRDTYGVAGSRRRIAEG
jgi:fructose-bisphosphate aldolase class II